MLSKADMIQMLDGVSNDQCDFFLASQSPKYTGQVINGSALLNKGQQIFVKGSDSSASSLGGRARLPSVCAPRFRTLFVRSSRFSSSPETESQHALRMQSARARLPIGCVFTSKSSNQEMSSFSRYVYKPPACPIEQLNL